MRLYENNESIAVLSKFYHSFPKLYNISLVQFLHLMHYMLVDHHLAVVQSQQFVKLMQYYVVYYLFLLELSTC